MKDKLYELWEEDWAPWILVLVLIVVSYYIGIAMIYIIVGGLDK